MKTKYVIVIASFLMGVFINLIYVVVDSLVLGESFSEAFRADSSEWWMRGIILFIMLASGILVSRAFIRRKQIEGKLQKANTQLQKADRLKSVFLASMSHELRTPLNSIIGFTSIIKDGLAGEINDTQRKQLGMVESSSKHLLSLINDVLDISKIEAGKVELIPDQFVFDDLMKEVIDSFLPMTGYKGLELINNTLPNTEMYNDRRRAKQVLTNLISNAVKFTEEGSIKIKGSIVNGDMLQVKVADTGAGIKEEAVTRLFQPFQQVDTNLVKSREGTGLGLYLSQKLAHLMGGDITVTSEYGKGSEFVFTTLLNIKGNSNE